MGQLDVGLRGGGRKEVTTPSHCFKHFFFRLLVNLTQPAILCFEDIKDRKDAEFTKSYMEINEYLLSYKEVSVAFIVQFLYCT